MKKKNIITPEALNESVKTVEQVLLRDMLIKQLPDQLIKGFDSMAAICRMNRSEFFMEVYDRIDPIFKKIKFLADRKAGEEIQKLSRRRRGKKRA